LGPQSPQRILRTRETRSDFRGHPSPLASGHSFDGETLRAAVLHPGLPEALSGSSARCAGESRPSAPLALGVRRGVRDQAHQLRAIRAGGPLSESAVERWLLHPQMRSQRPCGETVDPRVIEHMPRTAQDCCTIESRLFLSHACTLSSITLSLIRCHFSLPLVARWPRSSSRLASTPPAWAW